MSGLCLILGLEDHRYPGVLTSLEVEAKAIWNRLDLVNLNGHGNLRWKIIDDVRKYRWGDLVPKQHPDVLLPPAPGSGKGPGAGIVENPGPRTPSWCQGVRILNRAPSDNGRIGGSDNSPSARAAPIFPPMSIELMRKRLAADRASFIEPCLPIPPTSRRRAPTGFMRSSTMAIG